MIKQDVAQRQLLYGDKEPRRGFKDEYDGNFMGTKWTMSIDYIFHIFRQCTAFIYRNVGGLVGGCGLHKSQCNLY